MRLQFFSGSVAQSGRPQFGLTVAPTWHDVGNMRLGNIDGMQFHQFGAPPGLP